MTRAILPQARVDDLIVQPLPPDEVLVYDQRNHKAHCLNWSAALVWAACDGQTALDAVVERLQGKLGGAPREAAEDAVWVALDRLSRSGLLQAPVTPPALAEGISRREFIRKAAAAVAVGLPVVASITAQPAAAQGTYISPQQCNALTVGRCCDTRRRCRQTGTSGNYQCNGDPC